MKLKVYNFLINLDEISQDYIDNAHIIIGKNVKKLRESKNMSQLELSQRIGHKSVSVVSCSEICHNNYHFNIEHLLKIAIVLEVNIVDFFDGI